MSIVLVTGATSGFGDAIARRLEVEREIAERTAAPSNAPNGAAPSPTRSGSASCRSRST